MKAKIPTLICTNYCYVPNMLCKDLNFVPEIALHFDERYKFAIAFSSVEDDVYFGRQVKDSCYVEIYDVGDTDVFQIGDPFFKEYYTVFSANNNTMGFGLSIERNVLDDPAINDTTPEAPVPGPMPLPAAEPTPNALPVVPLAPNDPSLPAVVPEGVSENVVPLATLITGAGCFLFLVIAMSYFFCCRPTVLRNIDGDDNNGISAI